MTSPIFDPIAETIALARGQEQLRQEKETFDQKKTQDKRWFVMRLAMGWVAILLLPSIGAVAAWIIWHHEQFETSTVTIASTTLLVDLFGVMVSIWRVVMGSGPEVLGPTVKDSFDN